MIITLHGIPCKLEYSFSGLFVTDDEWIHPTRIIDTYEILLVIHGEVYLYEADAEYHLRPGDLILLNPGVEHGGYRASTGHTSFYWGHFSADCLECLGLRAGLHTPVEPDRLISAFRLLLHAGNTPGYPSYATDAAIASLLAEISASQARSDTDSCRLVHEIAEWIRINSDKKLTVRSVSDHFTYHPDYLCALMKSTLNKGLKEYINEERMKRLKTLLLTTALSIKELAARLNFDNENQLVHYFKYHEGISPIRFRNQYVNTHLNRQ